MSKVTIYTTPWCGFCKTAKNYMTDNGVQFEEKNVEQDQEAAIEAVKKSNQMGVPVIDVNGTIIVGFNKTLLDQALTREKLI